MAIPQITRCDVAVTCFAAGTHFEAFGVWYTAIYAAGLLSTIIVAKEGVHYLLDLWDKRRAPSK